MFNWLRNAFSRFRDARERSEIAARVDQLELEWGDVLDKLRAREERERKRNRQKVVASAAEDCVDCGPEAGNPGIASDPMKGDLWAQGRSLFSKQRGVQ